MSAASAGGDEPPSSSMSLDPISTASTTICSSPSSESASKSSMQFSTSSSASSLNPAASQLAVDASASAVESAAKDPLLLLKRALDMMAADYPNATFPVLEG